MPSPRESSQPRNGTQVSHITGELFTVWASREDGGAQNTGVGSLSLLQGIFLTPGIEPVSTALQADSSPVRDLKLGVFSI